MRAPALPSQIAILSVFDVPLRFEHSEVLLGPKGRIALCPRQPGGVEPSHFVLAQVFTAWWLLPVHPQAPSPGRTLGFPETKWHDLSPPLF